MASIPGVDGLFALVQSRNGGSFAEATGQASGAAGRAVGLGVVAMGAAVRAAAGLVEGVAGTARATAQTAQQARETVQAAHRLTLRADGIVAELEEPLRALAPGLTRLAAVLDDPVIDTAPDTLRRVKDDLLPVLRTLADTHERVAFIAGSTERILSFVDDTGRSLAGLPGAGLLGRRRLPSRVVTVEQVKPPEPAP